MITLHKYLDFDKDWWNNKFPNQRYGQAFCNVFNITNLELFHVDDILKAHRIIKQSYLKKCDLS